jgi:hypothetical protein
MSSLDNVNSAFASAMTGSSTKGQNSGRAQIMDWKVIEIEHMERDNVMLIPSRRGLEEIGKQEGVARN